MREKKSRKCCGDEDPAFICYIIVQGKVIEALTVHEHCAVTPQMTRGVACDAVLCALRCGHSKDERIRESLGIINIIYIGPFLYTPA